MHHEARITLAGTINKLELEYGARNTPILDIRLDGQVQNPTEDGKSVTRSYHHHVRVIGAYATGLYSALKEGQPALAHGRLEQFRYTTREGENKSLTRIIADGVSLLTGAEPTITTENGRQLLARGKNLVTIVGRLTHEPQLKTAKNGDAYLQTGVAVEEYGTTHYFNITAWRSLAERLAQASKGDAIHLTGQLVNHTWKDQAGNQRHTVSIEARDAHTLKYARPKPNPRMAKAA